MYAFVLHVLGSLGIDYIGWLIGELARQEGREAKAAQGEFCYTAEGFAICNSNVPHKEVRHRVYVLAGSQDGEMDGSNGNTGK